MDKTINESLESSQLHRQIISAEEFLKRLQSYNSYEDAVSFSDKSELATIDHAMKRKGNDFRQALDEVIKNTSYFLECDKRDYAKMLDIEEKMRALSEVLKSGLSSGYDLHVVDDFRMYVIPSEEDEKEFVRNCTRFVDRIANIIEGDYYVTGRGGSWTAWDLKSSEGIVLKAGYASSSVEDWAPEHTWFVKIASEYKPSQNET